MPSLASIRATGWISSRGRLLDSANATRKNPFPRRSPGVGTGSIASGSREDMLPLVNEEKALSGRAHRDTSLELDPRHFRTEDF